MSEKPLLLVNNLCMRFGGLLAVNNVALMLNEGEIVSLIGPNGAGKTTVFNCLTGFIARAAARLNCATVSLRGWLGSKLHEWAWYARFSMSACSKR